MAQPSNEQTEEWVRSLIEDSLADEDGVRAALVWLEKCHIALRVTTELDAEVAAGSKEPKSV